MMCIPHDPAHANPLTTAKAPHLSQIPTMMAKPIALLALCCLLCGTALAARPDDAYDIEGKGKFPTS